MEFSVGFSQQQRQAFSPQQQQGLQLLQAPIMELQRLIASELVSNPVLEEEKNSSSDLDSSLPEDSREDPQEDPHLSSHEEVDFFNDDLFQTASVNNRALEEERRRYLLESRPTTATLAETLSAQSVAFSLEDQPIAQSIIGNLDDAGYFRASTIEVAQSLGVVTEIQVDKVLRQLQQLDPPGVAARDLSECLQLQLERLGKGNSLASRIVRHHLPELARHADESIARALHVSLVEIQQARKIISKLEPNPGRPYAQVNLLEIIPDVIVIEEGDGFLVRLNDERMPRIKISDSYKELLAVESENKELREYLGEKIRGGKNFLQNIELRKETLLAISREIVRYQHDFFKYGAYAMLPLTMAQVADATGVHATTVSRAVSGKYIETPQGLFSLKYFFTSGLHHQGGEDVSSEMIKLLLQQIIHHENAKHPFSDQKIVDLLAERGIVVARRTIANYRDQLGILPKQMRKK